ncbi:GTP-dependent dephospho-CoA kinase family protein [Haloprofundus salinisoli]|uniref:GTP-dependent dephospho-CoA kinase family protein n=1 Tax=Haloprofundus salinisoli TaxID=2876193 RepID=UPI001CCCD841|nr:GTP-dependent dephospho-CoA kinase family protein [Haloprofundus salinisoli]
MLRLPDELRGAFKEPLGPVYTDSERLLSETAGPIVAVGDVVTYHLRTADRDPDVAVIDGKTKREAVGDEIRRVLSGDNPRIEVENPAATLSEELLAALRDAVESDENTVVVVTEGEEDMATLPAILVAPVGSLVVYGQPDEGMVGVAVTPETKADARELMTQLAGDTDAAFETLGV